MIKCEKCSLPLKNIKKKMLPNKTFICAAECKKVKKPITKIEVPSSDTMTGRQAVTVCRPRNVLKSKVVPLEPVVSNITVNSKADRKELMGKKKGKKEAIAPTIEITAPTKNKGGRPKKSAQ